MLEKTARKTSSDPAQEKLRQDKANWNKEVSSFINDLIHLKKTMNGWPSKFFKERSRITQPIPADPTTIIGSLAGDFQQLAQRGESIVQEQLSYVKTRRQKQPHPAAPAPTNQAPATPATAQTPPEAPPASGGGNELSKQLAAFEQKYNEELVVEGSNKATRTWTRLLNAPGTIGWGKGTKKRRYRMTMLKKCAEIYKLLNKLQVKIVAPLSSKDSIKEAYEYSKKIKNEWSLALQSYESYKKLIEEEGASLPNEDLDKQLKNLKDGKEPEEERKDVSPPASPVVQPIVPTVAGPGDDLEAVALAKNIKNDYVSILRTRLAPESSAMLSASINSFMKEPTASKANVARTVIKQYNLLLNTLKLEYGVVGNSLKEIEKAIVAKEKTNAQSASDQLEAAAQAMIKKWVGKARHNALPNDTSDYRLNIYEVADDLRGDLNALMDLLESRNTLIDAYDPKFKEISASIQSLDSRMLRLFRVYFRVPKGLEESQGWL